MYEEKLKILSIKDTCTGCLACVAACPTKCIQAAYDSEGFWTPQLIEPNKCINCHKCEKVCHVISRPERERIDKPAWWKKSTAYSFKHGQEDIRAKSTSGGAMSAIAKYIMDAGGVIFASRYDGVEKKLVFASSDDYSISLFRKSRYFESCTDGVFLQVKESLKKNRKVMFVGTPCHVKALKTFLGKEVNNDNLLTVNFVCHGVPSNQIYHQYLAKQYGITNIVNIDSRYQDKTHGWHSLFVRIELPDGSKVIPYGYDSFHMSFIRNGYLRRSCYKCDDLFGDAADITIGDFWGVKYLSSESDDNIGLSLVFLHTPKAEECTRVLSSHGKLEKIPYSCLNYLLDESKAKDISQRFNGNKEEYLDHLINDYRYTIWRNKIKALLKTVLRK